MVSPGTLHGTQSNQVRAWIDREWAAVSKDAGGADRTRGQHSETLAEPLSDSQQQAFNLICKEGPLLGRQIVNKLGIGSESTFTTHYVPSLKRHGIKNRRGLGYYHPDHYRAQ